MAPTSSGKPAVQQSTPVERVDANTLQASIKAHFTFLLTTSCMFPNGTQCLELIGQSCIHAQSEYPHHNSRLVTQDVIDKGSVAYTTKLLPSLTSKFRLQRTIPHVITTSSRILLDVSSLKSTAFKWSLVMRTWRRHIGCSMGWISTLWNGEILRYVCLQTQ